MFGWGKTGTVHASATVSPARSQKIYRRYAVVLYRQALLNLDDPASAGHVIGDLLVNECALAVMPEHGEDDARFRLAESVLRRPRPLAARPAQQDRRSEQGLPAASGPACLRWHARLLSTTGTRLQLRQPRANLQLPRTMPRTGRRVAGATCPM